MPPIKIPSKQLQIQLIKSGNIENNVVQFWKIVYKKKQKQSILKELLPDFFEPIMHCWTLQLNFICLVQSASCLCL